MISLMNRIHHASITVGIARSCRQDLGDPEARKDADGLAHPGSTGQLQHANLGRYAGMLGPRRILFGDFCHGAQSRDWTPGALPTQPPHLRGVEVINEPFAAWLRRLRSVSLI